MVVPRRSSYGAVSYPNTLLEAMACGRPVVCTDLPGISEVVEHGRSGFLVAPGRPDLLRQCLLDLLGRPADLTAAATNARARMLEVFAWTRVAAATAQALVGLRPGAAPAP